MGALHLPFQFTSSLMVYTRRSTLFQPRMVATRSANVSILFALESNDTTYSYVVRRDGVRLLCAIFPFHPFYDMTNAWFSISCASSVFDRSQEQLPFQTSYSCQISQHDATPTLVLATLPFPVHTA